VDRSQSYAGGDAAWLRSGEGVRRQNSLLRRYYSDQGFQIHTVDFGEFACASGNRADLGVLTRLSALQKYLDSAAIPNLQGIFLWSDGRFNLDTVGSSSSGWSVPIFPVLTEGAGSGEVQGEVLQLDFTQPDSGVKGSLTWNCLRPGPCRANLELQAGGSKIWSGMVSGESMGNGGFITNRIPLPRGLRLDADLNWSAALRPEKSGDNSVPWNDSIRVRVLGGRKLRNLFVRPIRSLEERGLMDAIRNGDSLDAAAMAPESLETASRNGDVIWLPRNGGARMNGIASRADARGVPVVFYSFAANHPAGGPSGFSSEAKSVWVQAGEAWLPGGVARLADLGGTVWDLPAPDTGKGRLVWVEEKGRTGQLLSARANGIRVWDAILPGFWSTGFQPEADFRIRSNQHEWVQGIANWIRTGEEKIRKVGPVLSGVHSRANPAGVELALLGTDVQGMESLAEATRGLVIRTENFSSRKGESGFPKFSTGQTAEEKTKSTPLLPPGILGLIAAIFLCVLWAIRKLSHLD